MLFHVNTMHNVLVTTVVPMYGSRIIYSSKMDFVQILYYYDVQSYCVTTDKRTVYSEANINSINRWKQPTSAGSVLRDSVSRGRCWARNKKPTAGEIEMSPTESVCDFKDVFDETIGRLDLKVNSFCIRDVEHYRRIVAEVIDAKSRTKKSPLDYRRLKRYDVLLAAGGDRAQAKLIRPRSDHGTHPVRYYVHNGELFDVLRASHLSTGHGGLHKMHADVGRKYANVTRPVIQTFLANCDACLEQRRQLRRDRQFADSGGGTVVRPRSDEATTTAEIHFADMRSCCAGDDRYRFVMTYCVDGASKFVVSRPLEAKTAGEVARQLIDVFCVFGAPATIVHREDDRPFVDSLADRLRETTCPPVEIRRGHDRCRRNGDGGRRRADTTNADLREFLRTWTAQNNTTRWSEGLRFYQFRRNNTFRPDVGRSPFEALLERRTETGFTSRAVSEFTGKNENGWRGSVENLPCRAEIFSFLQYGSFWLPQYSNVLMTCFVFFFFSIC